MNEDSLESLIIENFSKPVAFFDDDGNIVLSNKEWDNFYGKGEGIENVFTYKEFLDKVGLTEQGENIDYDCVKTRCCCNLTVVVKRKKICTENISGFLVEIEDVSGSEESSFQIKKL